MQAIAHEIKTPLTAIQGSSEMISEGGMPEQQRTEMAGLIHKESKRLTALIQTFLNVERLASGSLSLQHQQVDLGVLCQEIVERGRFLRCPQTHSDRATIPEIHVSADPDLLVRDLQPDHEWREVQPGKHDRQTDCGGQRPEVRISVADQGYGIATADQERIFEKFYRLKRDERSAEEGTGIGLALVKEIVHQHGGQITVESAPNTGSRFTIALPRG
ncbi:MAG: hypothetical protein IPP47_19950 [Bryobacterales bacterium]|nr:hypothetical protein [Bryobacterales bacterium]